LILRLDVGDISVVLSSFISSYKVTKDTLYPLSKASYASAVARCVFPLCKTLHKGKTHLGIALGIKAINQNKTVYFFTVHELINRLVKESENGTSERFMKKLKKADLLILDEWGYLPLHQEGARLLFEVISMCYEQKSIIITTNIEFSHWKNFLFDEKLTAAIIDRVIHHSHLLVFDGPSHRKQNALLK